MKPKPRMNPTTRRLLTASACALTLSALPALAQQAPAPAPERNTTTAAAVTPTEVKAPAEGAAATTEDVVILSPFEVVGDTKGYYAANTMSGTRMATKIEDLGQSITVMTKEMMSDFAMTDINDVFDYMASTEGTNTYSEFTTDRTGAVVDNVSLSPNSANRVRGIGSANTAFNNIATTGRVPVDSLWMDSLELSRGPNANIFGLGNASGTVNQVPATANLSRDFTKIDLRTDDTGGWRASADINRILLADKLAIRASYANQHTGFVRKPSGEDARRLSLQLKVKPFKNTTMSASVYDYKAASMRPNFTTPRDYYSDWVEMGRPGWNPVTRLVTFENGNVWGNGNVLGSTTPYGSAPTFFAGTENRSIFRIGLPEETSYWARTRLTNAAATNNTAQFASTDPFAASDLSGSLGIGFLNTGASQYYTATQQPLFNSVRRPIDDLSIYDWNRINLMGNSKAWDDVTIYLGQIDQFILNTPKHTLAAQLTVMREDSDRTEDQPMGRASVNSNVGELQVDVNMVNLDGTPNPYFGRPYLRSNEPFLRIDRQVWDTARAQAVYKLDFSRDKGWTKWLGSQQVLGYYEYKDQQRRRYAYRHSAVGLEHDWQQKYYLLNTPLGARTQTGVDPKYPVAPGNYARINEQYYVGGKFKGIEYAPSSFPNDTRVAYVWGPSSTTLRSDMTTIGWTPSPDAGGSFASVQNIIKTLGGVLHSNFLDNRLVATFGLREDNVFERNGKFATLTPDLKDYYFKASDQWQAPWRPAAGKTKNFSLVVRPIRDLGVLNRSMAAGGIGGFFAEALSSLGLTYNKADNFIAQGPAFDLYLNPVPNQSGLTKDIGLWMTLFDGKMSIRYTRFDTQQFDLRQEDIWTMAQRVQRLDGTVANDAWNLRKQATAWLGGTPTNAQIAAAIKMPADQYEGLLILGANQTYAASQDMQSKGDELEINYNATKAWTVSASVTKTESINTAVGSEVDDFLAERRAVWESLEDPRFTATTYIPEGGGAPIPYAPVVVGGVSVPFVSTLPVGPTGHLLWYYIKGAPFTTVGGYNNTSSAQDYVIANVDAPMSVFRAMIGRPRPQVRKYSVKFNTKYSLSGLTDHRILKNISVGGSLRWASKGSIGFYGLGYDPAKNLALPENKILQLDPDRPIWSPAETYIDLFISYRTKLYRDKVRATFQLNVKNVGEDGGGLQAVGAFLDGSPSAYRIIDPRQFVLSASFEL